MKILNVFNKQKPKDRPKFILAQDGEVISTSDLEKMKAERLLGILEEGIINL